MVSIYIKSDESPYRKLGAKYSFIEIPYKTIRYEQLSCRGMNCSAPN